MTFRAAAHFCKDDQAESCACHERRLTTGCSGRSAARPAAEPERYSNSRLQPTQPAPSLSRLRYDSACGRRRLQRRFVSRRNNRLWQEEV